MKNKMYTMKFATIYPLYLAKAIRKKRTTEEVNEVISWLTGYSEEDIKIKIESEVTMEEFFKEAPTMNPNRELIKGSICGVKLAEIEDDIEKDIRYLDKLVDELAKGKVMEKILRK